MAGAGLGAALALAASLLTGAAMAHPLLSRLTAQTQGRQLAFAELPGWVEDDHGAAFRAFLETCAPILDGAAVLREGLAPGEALVAACRAARLATAAEARAFFESRFIPVEIRPEGGEGFLTAYFEPEIEGALRPSAAFPVPLLARPADLVTFGPGEAPPGVPPGLQAARRTQGGLQPFPDRAAIWAGALEGQGLEIAWLKDHAEVFIIQIQGSARLRLADGRVTRLVYAGRNGLPYTSIGRRIVQDGHMRLEETTLARLMAFLRADPQRGRKLMEENRSYVFFARNDTLDPAKGPIGGAGVPLTPQRSLAIDRRFWPYGLPVYISAHPLAPDGSRTRLERLMIAQDTGSAIVGPARADYFMGSGPAAGESAGLVRDPLRFIVLLPKLEAP